MSKGLCQPAKATEEHDGGLPEHWECLPIKRLLSFGNGRDYKDLLESGDDYPVYGSGGEFARVGSYLHEGDSVLFGRKGTVDRPLFVSGRFWTVDTMYFTRVNPDACAKFLYYSALTIPYSLYSTNTALPSMTQELLGKHKIPVPPFKEQAKIARFLDHETAKIDRLIEKQQQLIALLKEKRQAVISHAVTKGLNPNAPMKDSGVEWLGQVPAHWDIRRLKHVSPRVGVGLVINPSTYTRDEGVYFLFGGDVKEHGFDLLNTRRMSAVDSDRLAPSRLNAGDLVVVRVGDPGVSAVVPPELEGANCASVVVVRRGDFDSGWLCAAMNSWVGRTQVGRVSYGAAQKQFNVSDAVEFLFPVPPYDEQAQVAEFVQDRLEFFLELSAKANSAISILQERRSALISAAVTGKIDVRDWTPPADEELAAA